MTRIEVRFVHWLYIVGTWFNILLDHEPPEAEMTGLGTARCRCVDTVSSSSLVVMVDRAATSWVAQLEIGRCINTFILQHSAREQSTASCAHHLLECLFLFHAILSNRRHSANPSLSRSAHSHCIPQFGPPSLSHLSTVLTAMDLSPFPA